MNIPESVVRDIDEIVEFWTMENRKVEARKEGAGLR